LRTNKLFLQFVFVFLGFLSLSLVLLTQMHLIYASSVNSLSAYAKLQRPHLTVRVYEQDNFTENTADYIKRAKKINFLQQYNPVTLVPGRSAALRIRKEYLARLAFSYTVSKVTSRVSRLKNQEKYPISAEMSKYLTKKVAGKSIVNLKAVLHESYVHLQQSKKTANFFQNLELRK